MITRIKKIMESKQINAAQFADEIGVQRSALSHVLSSRNKPSLDFMLKIKQRYPEINLDWLLIGSGEILENKKIINLEQVKIDLFAQEEKTHETKLESIQENLKTETAEIPVNMIENETIKIKSSNKRTPKQVILLFDDSTFELFGGIPCV